MRVELFNDLWFIPSDPEKRREGEKKRGQGERATQNMQVTDKITLGYEPSIIEMAFQE